MDKRLIVLLASFMILAAGVSSAATSVVFYEYRSSASYKSDTGYSTFKQELIDNGYSVSRLDIPLSREVLDSYAPDVLIIPELSQSLEADELAAVFEFVMQDGKGLFILGGGCAKKGSTCYANQITIPFGMSIDEGGILEDETSPVMKKSSAMPEKTNFVVSTLERQDPMIRLIVQGVNRLGFFEGNGVELTGDAIVVAMGDWDTYSPKSSTFPKGSKPPVASAALVGSGLVFVLSDADMLENTYLVKSDFNYDNLRFGTNVVDWLRSKRDVTDSRALDELTMIIGQMNTDIEYMNQTIYALEAEKKTLEGTVASKNAEITVLDAQLKDLESQSIGGIKYTTIALGLLAFGVLGVAVNLTEKNKKSKAKKEDDAGGFGYEFDEGSTEFGGAGEGFDDLMDMNKKKE